MMLRFGRGCAAVAAVLAPVAQAHAAATPAGTIISNIADIGFRMDGTTRALRSNKVDIVVGEIIKYSVTPVPACGTGVASDGKEAIGFRITNLGNGVEEFVPGSVRVTGGGTFVPTAIVEDTNGNGCYDPGIDQIIPPGGATPPLAPGQSTIIFVIGTGGNGTGRIVIRVSPRTGGGGTTTTTSIPGGGDGGGDAVIPPSDTDGDGSAPTPLSSPLVATLVKTQSIPGAAQRGAVITYKLEGNFAGTGVATEAAIADSIPAGTTYVPGSLALDGQKISDAADGDAGQFDGAGVRIKLGNVVAPAVHTVSFQVEIN